MRYSPWSCKRRRRLSAEELAAQLCIDLQPRAPAWVDPDDIPEDGDFPAHLVVSAAACEPVKTRAPCSVFAFAASQFCAERAARQVISEVMYGVLGDDEEPPAPRLPSHCRKIVRDGDVTRHIALREQDTEEWAEKERARRAKQKPPRPTKQKFKMKGTRQWADQAS